MEPLKTVLVGLDFSDCSKVALAQAARVARANAATLHAFHVLVLSSSTDEERTAVTEFAEKELEEYLTQVELPAKVERHIVWGSPIHETLRLVKDLHADLLVMGVTGLTDSGIGTTATKCVRSAPTKVLLVDRKQSQPFRNIVACVDFSETSQLAVGAAVRAAKRTDGKLHLLHVYYGPWNQLHYRAPTPEASPEFKQQYLSALSSRLSACLEEFAAEVEGLEVEHQLVENLSSGRGVVDYAKSVDADLVVLGTRGRTNLRYILMGSTAERVLRDVHCSVLAVKPPEFDVTID